MDKDKRRLEMEDYATIKDAAEMLGLSEKRVYEYVREGRFNHKYIGNVIIISKEEIRNFKRGAPGRPRTRTPEWHITPEGDSLQSLCISVSVRVGQQGRLQQKWEAIRQREDLLFAGTRARYILGSKEDRERILILFIWRSAIMPDEQERERELEAFRRELADVLDWSTARYEYGRVYMHT